MNSQFWWYVARSSGLVAWVLSFATILWGVLLATRVLKPADRPAWLLDLHRWLGGLTVAFTALHMAALVLDNYVDFGARELLVPLAGDWKPGPVAWGVVSMYLLVAIQATSLMMRRLPKRLWRWIHLASYALFVMITVHAIQAGTDATAGWFVRFSTGLAMLGAATAGLRIVKGRYASQARHTPVGSSGGAPSRERTRIPAGLVRAGDGANNLENNPCTTNPPPPLPSPPTSSSSWTAPDPWPPSPETSSAASTPSSRTSRRPARTRG